MCEKYIHRVEKDGNYTIANNSFINDQRLSNKAKGLFIQMLSKPDNWIFHNDEMQTWSTDGREALANAIKELQKYGYIERVRKRGPAGKFIYETHVYEVPLTALPSTGKPLTDKPYTAEPLTENMQLVSTDKASTNKINNTSIQQAEQFNLWWNLYNKKIGKAKCETKFKQLLKKYNYPQIEEGTKRYLQYMQQNNTAKQYQKNPLTFLNGEHFNDEYESSSSQGASPAANIGTAKLILDEE